MDMFVKFVTVLFMLFVLVAAGVTPIRSALAVLTILFTMNYPLIRTKVIRWYRQIMHT